MRITTKKLTAVFIVITAFLFTYAHTASDLLPCAICYTLSGVMGFAAIIGVLSTISEQQEKN